MSVTPTPEAVQQVFQLMTGHIVVSAVNIAAQLGIADRLADAAGFELTRIVPTHSPLSVVEAKPRP